MGRWTGGRKKTTKAPEPTKEGSALFILEIAFLIKRDRKGGISKTKMRELSEKTLIEVGAKWDHVLVFLSADQSVKYKGPDVEKCVKRLGLSNISIINCPMFYDAVDPKSIIRTVKRCLIEHGAVLRKLKNPRDINNLNIDRYVESSHIQFARHDSHKKLGITLDKEVNLLELQEKRKLTAEW